jgi:hypothetical protein
MRSGSVVCWNQQRTGDMKRATSALCQAASRRYMLELDRSRLTTNKQCGLLAARTRINTVASLLGKDGRGETGYETFQPRG